MKRNNCGRLHFIPSARSFPTAITTKHGASGSTATRSHTVLAPTLPGGSPRRVPRLITFLCPRPRRLRNNATNSHTPKAQPELYPYLAFDFLRDIAESQLTYGTVNCNQKSTLFADKMGTGDGPLVSAREPVFPYGSRGGSVGATQGLGILHPHSAYAASEACLALRVHQRSIS